MTNLSLIKIIAAFTAKEVFKSKIIINILFLGALLSLLVYVVSEFTYGVAPRIALDFSLGTVSITTNAISIFLGVGLLSKEIESRTLYMVLSRPISRSTFVIGKILGLIFVQVVITFILASLSLSVFFLLDGQWQSLIAWAFFFNFLESLLLLLIVIFFSLFTNTVIAVSNTIVLLVCGHAVNEAASTSLAKSNELVAFLLKVYSLIFPNFYKLNLKDYVLYEQRLASNYLLTGSLYGFCYIALVLGMICFIFQKKDLN